ncbi:MAG: hypothetical protein IKG14_02935 [Clostridia bacterium]|nr:hypothetical protein [Clostridia bacterium]
MKDDLEKGIEKIVIKLKKEEGITVVALVISIIVLLILSGISISLFFGDNGLLKSTEFASNMYANSSKEEISLMDEIDSSIKESLVDMYKKGQIKIGDYLDYEIAEEGDFVTDAYGNENSNGFFEQKYSVYNNGKSINWKVLGLGDDEGKLTTDLDKGNHLLLVAGSPVEKVINNESENEFERDPYLYMGKAESFVNGENILNGIANIFVNNKTSDMGRSLNVDDINKILGIEVTNEKVYEMSDESKTNIDQLRTMGQAYAYEESDYSANSYLNNNINAIRNGEETVVGTSYSYLIDSYKDRVIGNTTVGKLLFNETDFDNKNSKAYWIANKGVEVNRKVIYGLSAIFFDSVKIGIENFNSKGNWIVQGLGVYPVISLKSDISTDVLHIVSKEEEKWSYNNNKIYSGNIGNYNSIGILSAMF